MSELEKAKEDLAVWQRIEKETWELYEAARKYEDGVKSIHEDAAGNMEKARRIVEGLLKGEK
jgi:exonuclease VII small subunit